MRYSKSIQGMIAGMLGGLVGTILMYFFGAGIFALLGWPANTSFSIIGNSAAAFFSKLGIALAGGSPLGMLLYCLIGLTLGAIWGIAGVSLEPLHLASFKKRVGLSVLYVEVMSLPLLAAGTLALKMNAADAALWFGISFVMHLVYGLVLGVVTSYGVSGVVLDPARVSSRMFASPAQIQPQLQPLDDEFTVEDRDNEKREESW